MSLRSAIFWCTPEAWPMDVLVPEHAMLEDFIWRCIYEHERKHGQTPERLVLDDFEWAIVVCVLAKIERQKGQVKVCDRPAFPRNHASGLAISTPVQLVISGWGPPELDATGRRV